MQADTYVCKRTSAKKKALQPEQASAGSHVVVLLAIVLLLAGAAGTGEAATYYYDNNGTNAGFGAAGGTWAAPTPGPTPGWSTDSTGTNVPASVTTATSDALNFGTGAAGLAGGTITISGTQNAGDMTFGSASGDITFSGGTLNLAAAVTLACGQAAGTGAALDASVTLTGAGTSFAKTGTGKLRVDGGSALSGTLTFSSGMLVLAGSNTVTMGAISVSSGTPANGWLEIGSGGNYTAASLASTVSSSVVKLAGGALTLSGGFTIGAANATHSSNGFMGGGALACGSFQVCALTFRMSGGTVSVAGGTRVGTNNTGNGGNATLIISGGQFTSGGQVYLFGYQGNENVFVGGGTSPATLTVSLANDSIKLGGFFNFNSTGNLYISDKGVVEAHEIVRGTGLGDVMCTVTFHGGTLRALSSTDEFLGSCNTPASGNNALGSITLGNVAYIYAGGATIDTQGYTVTASPAFLPRSTQISNGVLSVTPGAGAGSGYALAPNVTFSGGGGAGAVGYATLGSNGEVAAVVVTDPGSGYTSAPTVTFSGGTLGPGGVAASGTWDTTIVNSTGGGLTKIGAGTLTLAGTNSAYTGPTVVSNGTLKVNGAILGTGTVTVVGGGTLGGTGTVAGATSVQAGGTLSAGDGGRGEMTFTGNLTIESGSTSAVDIAAVNLSDRVNVTGTLMIQPNAGVVVSDHANGIYTVFQYGTLSGSARNLRVVNMQGGKIYPFRTEGNAVILDIRWGGTVVVIR